MSSSVLLDKSKTLALEVIKLCNEVKPIKKNPFALKECAESEYWLELLQNVDTLIENCHGALRGSEEDPDCIHKHSKE